MMNALALGLFRVWLVVMFIVRSLVHKRRTGDSGIQRGAFAVGCSPPPLYWGYKRGSIRKRGGPPSSHTS